MKNFKKILLVLIVIALIVAIVAVTASVVLSKTDKKANPIVTMEVEGYGTIKMELYPDMAPNTVKNFIKLAQRGFYNGKTFSDVEKGLVQGGFDIVPEDSGEIAGPKLSNIKDLPEGTKDTTYTIEGEFIENGYNNTLSHQRGVISMYRTTYAQYQQEIAMLQMMGYSNNNLNGILEEMYDSQASGFFILTEDNISFDGTYAAFGKVTEGMDIVDKISKLELEKTTSEDGKETASTKIVNAPVISNVSVETFGVNYGEPTTTTVMDFDALFSAVMQSYMQSSSTTEQ